MRGGSFVSVELTIDSGFGAEEEEEENDEDEDEEDENDEDEGAERDRERIRGCGDIVSEGGRDAPGVGGGVFSVTVSSEEPKGTEEGHSGFFNESCEGLIYNTTHEITPPLRGKKKRQDEIKTYANSRSLLPRNIRDSSSE